MINEDFIYEIYELLGHLQVLQNMLKLSVMRKDLKEINYVQRRMASINKDLEKLLDSELGIIR